ncbi:4-hydroxy-tetrahydrodipicolinate synthase [Tenacibaculum finnmarkense genomovar finnmarkense]|uniref:4-hydroxy-tetrahydrodipicolinate synthase n=1 Tax=Tenacibaculum finnmarkense genomovar finnmarkense TaxID=1458503 RepID=A0AAP1WGX7_9FLAO|nr:4-hydroxy-tetrahydrodipicolinate synthase [Tenacibaculum finnmarkense]MBE7653466.1 4-hydroxy-tetrahydrodipicolinate synthase [Tenacibaculum finnmarkense genomovar finnmarkense]MBE7695770.1 4-hydroxy-tetrahydrodipicolinate synthase [Tenacibaculum finnmarkense genomovar finnmarkense]MCD8402778.1 4-hydroxy-tetrahydrodipicolinate synthase [Tenacibaculum finnmarkense genomovar finnmarkense]MCD8413228.1 4-hydroxy-tetrahydrodipicolinate synthase [Tenacibaculum finnmarkense genomovar ulcerans]MCD84
MQKFVGTGVALVTPFSEDLSVDFQALKKLVNYNIDNGTNYLVINGTTAESATITTQEKVEIIKVIAAENNGRLPLVLGLGGNNTQVVIDELKSADLSNIDGILSVAPYYSKPTQEGFYQHFKAIALATKKPIILYNVPGRTAKNMEPATILRLANDFKNIVGVKEAGNNQQQYLALLKDKPKDFLIISGDDDLALGVVLAGGAGVISVIGQGFPKKFSKMIQLGLAGKNKKAYKIHYQLMDVVDYIFEENNPAGIKAVLLKKGICLDEVRLPLVKASEELQTKISDFTDAF